MQNFINHLIWNQNNFNKYQNFLHWVVPFSRSSIVVDCRLCELVIGTSIFFLHFQYPHNQVDYYFHISLFYFFFFLQYHSILLLLHIFYSTFFCYFPMVGTKSDWILILIDRIHENYIVSEVVLLWVEVYLIFVINVISDFVIVIIVVNFVLLSTETFILSSSQIEMVIKLLVILVIFFLELFVDWS